MRSSQGAIQPPPDSRNRDARPRVAIDDTAPDHAHRRQHHLQRVRDHVPGRAVPLYIGPHKIMWATDYPHQNGFFPGAPDMVRERLGPLSAAARHQVLAGGAMGFYALQ